MIKMIVESEDLKPKIHTEGSAGFDLKIASDVHIRPGQVVKVGTGVKVQIPEGYVGLVLPRSSCEGIVLQNVTGVIDSDYQGEIFLKLRNTTSKDFLAYRGDRLMQMIVVPFESKAMFVSSFDTVTERGEKGFGSTNTKKPAS